MPIKKGNILLEIPDIDCELIGLSKLVSENNSVKNKIPLYLHNIRIIGDGSAVHEYFSFNITLLSNISDNIYTLSGLCDILNLENIVNEIYLCGSGYFYNSSGNKVFDPLYRVKITYNTNTSSADIKLLFPTLNFEYSFTNKSTISISDNVVQLISEDEISDANEITLPSSSLIDENHDLYLKDENKKIAFTDDTETTTAERILLTKEQFKNTVLTESSFFAHMIYAQLQSNDNYNFFVYLCRIDRNGSPKTKENFIYELPSYEISCIGYTDYALTVNYKYLIIGIRQGSSVNQAECMLYSGDSDMIKTGITKVIAIEDHVYKLR